MSLLKTKTKEIYYSGRKTYYLDGSASSIAVSDGENNWLHSLSMFEDCITADDIRVYFRDDTANTEVEVFDFRVSNTTITGTTESSALLTPVLSITEDGDAWQLYGEIDIANTTGAVIIELIEHECLTTRWIND